MDQRIYREILEKNLISTIQKYELNPNLVIFQHDNNPKHTAKSVQSWLAQQPFHILSSPAASPNLNPIEHLWAYLKAKLGKYKVYASNLDELWERIDNEWSNIPVSLCQQLIESMPRRIEAVIKAKGYWTKY